MKNTQKKRGMALLLSAVLLFSQMPVAAAAEAPTPEDGSIASFAALDSGVAERTVDVGTEKAALELPDELTATVYHVTEDMEITDDDTTSPSDAEEAEGETTITVTTTEEQIPVTWDSEPGYDGDVSAAYLFTANVGEFALAEGAELPEITVNVTDGEPEKPTHCTKTKGCTLPDGHEGECQLTPANDALTQTVTSWTFVDGENVNEGVLPLTGISAEQQASFDTVVGMLPTQISAVIGDNADPATLDISGWSCGEYTQDENGNWPLTGDYTFTAALPVGYALGGDAAPLTVNVILGGGNTLGANGTFGDLAVTTTSGTDAIQDEYGQILLKTGTYTISGTWNGTLSDVSFDTPKSVIRVQDGATANVTLDGVTIDVNTTERACAFEVAGKGICNLTLTGENTLESGNGKAGLQVAANRAGNIVSTLTITEGSSGSLTANGGNGAAGIGGGESSSGGTINIAGGTIVATGGDYGAGIGDGDYGGFSGWIPGSGSAAITISGGTVTVFAGSGGASGIGYGGDDNAQDGSFSTGTLGHAVITTPSIKTGNNKTEDDRKNWGGIFFINSTDGQLYGNPTVTSDFTISDSQTLTVPADATLTIDGGTLTNEGTLTIAANAALTMNGGGTLTNEGTFTITANAALTMNGGGALTNEGTLTLAANAALTMNGGGTLSNNGAVYKHKTANITGTVTGKEVISFGDNELWGDFIVTGGTESTNFTYADNMLTIKDSANLTISGTTTEDKIVVPDGVTANITLSDANIDVSGRDDAYAFEVAGNGICNLTLAGTNKLKSSARKAALQVQSNATLTIMQESVGSLDATGGSNAGAGIGGGGGITIGGGTVQATGGNEGVGGKGGAGIGGSGNITINSGTVTASGGNGGDGGGAGIGGGGDAIDNTATVTITGGTVFANGTNGGAGIGGGHGGKGGTITISGGVVTPVGNSTSGIGGGFRNESDVNFSTGDDGNAIIFGSIGNTTNQATWKGVLFLDKDNTIWTTADTATLPVDVSLGWLSIKIPNGKTLNLTNGATLTNRATSTVDGTLNISDGVLDNYGTIDVPVGGKFIVGNGIFNNHGNLTGGGTKPGDEDTGVQNKKSTVTLTTSALSGSAAYGDSVTLTATVADITPSSANLLRSTPIKTVFFYCDGKEIGNQTVGDNNIATLSVTLDTIAWKPGEHSLTAKYTGGNNHLLSSDSAAVNLTVTKDTPSATPPAPTATTAITATKVTLVAVAPGSNAYGTVQYGYKAPNEPDPGHWQNSNSFTGLTAETTYTFVTRYKGNSYYAPSAASENYTVTTAIAKPDTKTGYTIDYTTEKATAQSGYQISTDNTTWKTDEAVEIVPGGTLYVRVPKVGNTPASEATENTLDARPVAPTLELNTATESVTIPADYSYNITNSEHDADGWTQGSGNAVKVNSGANIYIYQAATGSAFKSAVQTLTAPNRGTTPNVEINYATETLPTTTAMQYSVNNGTNWTNCTADMNATEFDSWDGTKEKSVQFRTAATASAFASAALDLTIPARPTETPDVKITYADETLSTTAGMQYRVDGGTEWTDCTATMTATEFNEWDGTEEKPVQFRTAATASAFASAAQGVTIPARGSAPLLPVSLTMDDSNALTFTAAGGVEYSTDGMNWNTTGTFSGLSGTATLHARTAATDEAFHSAEATTGIYVGTPYTVTPSKTGDWYTADITLTGQSDVTLCSTGDGSFAGTLTINTESSRSSQDVFAKYDGGAAVKYPVFPYKLDKTTPTKPTLTASSTTDTGTTLTVADVTDSVSGIKEYTLTCTKGDLDARTSVSNTFALTDLTRNTEYKFAVTAKDNAGNVSEASEVCTVTTGKTSISGATVELSNVTALTYTGKSQPPTVTVTLGGNTLTGNTDYNVAYKNTNGGGDTTNAGTITVTVTGTGNYSGEAINKPTYTIGTATPTIAWGNTTQSVTYTGSAATVGGDNGITAPAVILENGEKFGGEIQYFYRENGSEGDFASGLPTNAGTYTVRAHINVNGNYTGADSSTDMTLTISPKEVGLEWQNATDRKYGDGKTVTATATGTMEGDSVAVTVENGDKTEVGNDYEAKATGLTGVSAENYKLPGAKTQKYSIAKADAQTLTAKNVAALYTDTSGQTVELSSAMPEDAGTLTYTAGTKTDDSGIIKSWAVDASVSVTFTLKDNLSFDSQTATLPVTISSTNYADSTVNVVVTLIDKTPVKITDVEVAEALIYNGKPQQGYTGDPTNNGGYTGEYDISYAGTGGTTYTGSTPPTNAGSYTVTFKVPDSNATYSGSATVNFTIAKKSLTVKPKDESVLKGGTMPTFALQYDGLVADEKLTPSTTPKFSCTETNTNTPGSYSITWSNKDGVSFTDDTVANYEINKQETGTLTIAEVLYKLIVVDGGTGSGDYAEGAVINLDAGTKSGYNFSGWTTTGGKLGSAATKVTTFTMPKGNATVTANWTSANSGSSGGGDYTPPTTPVTPTKPDTPATGEITPDKPDQNGNADIDEKDVIKAINEAKNKQASKNGVSLAAKLQSGTTSATLDRATLDKLIASGVKSFTLNYGGVSMTFDLAALKEIQQQSTGAVTFTAVKATGLTGDAKAAIGSRPAYELTVTDQKGGSVASVANFGAGGVSVAIAYTPAENELTGSLYAIYANGGKAEWITGSTYDRNAKAVIFSTGHFSTYGIGYKAPPVFSDTANHWAKADIDFVASRGLLFGTSETTFAPDGSMTRGMFVTALGRLVGIDAAAHQAGKFTDVPSTAYYAPYVNWAASVGIVSGTSDTTFAPDQAISRQQMATIIMNYVKAVGYELPKVHTEVTFADNANIASWAKDTVKATQMAGILMGKDNNQFNPTGTATRAEASAVLRRIVERMIDSSTADGWVQNDSGSWLYYENGQPVKSQTKDIGGEKYTFDASGITKDFPKKK